jgi:hypothetical protein
MTEETNGNRRQYSRIAFHAAGTLICSGASIAVTILDLSLKGALVSLPPNTPMQPSAACSLQVQLNEIETNDLISMEGRIAHAEGGNVGVLCTSIDIDSVTHLRRLVELNLGEPELLERELSALIAG